MFASLTFLLACLLVCIIAQRVSLEQQATEMLVRARADLFTVCKGRRRHHCHNEKRDELKALQVYYSIECSRVPLQESVLFRFCKQLDRLFEEKHDDDDDDVEKNVFSWDIAESARRRYAMICANHLNPRRCHRELEHELHEAREHYKNYCDEFIVAKTFDYNGTLAGQDRAVCRHRVEKIFDEHFEIQLGNDATFDQTNRRLIVWLAQQEARRICQHQPFHQCAASISNAFVNEAAGLFASTQAQQWADAKSRFQQMCFDVQIETNFFETTAIIVDAPFSASNIEAAGVLPGGTTPGTLAYSGANIGAAGGNIRNNTYFGFDENTLCINDVNAVFNFNYGDLQDRPHFWFAEHVNDLVADARGIHAFFCGARSSHECKEFWEHVEHEQRREGDYRNASDLIEDVKHVFLDACEAFPALTGGPQNFYAPAGPFLTDDGLYKILSGPPSAAVVNASEHANAQRERACKEAIEHIFDSRDDDDDDRPDSFEELFTNAKYRYNQICANQSATAPAPFSAAACAANNGHELRRARERGERECEHLAHHRPNVYGNGGDEYGTQVAPTLPPTPAAGIFGAPDRDRFIGDVGDDDDENGSWRKRNVADVEDHHDDHHHDDDDDGGDDDDSFREGCKRRVREIFDADPDPVEEEKLSLLTPDEIWRFARYKYGQVCGYHERCRRRGELRDWKRRLLKKCEQPQIRSGLIPQFVPGGPLLNETTCKHVLHDIFDDHHLHRAAFRKEVLDVARAFHAEICGPSNQVQSGGQVGGLYNRTTGLYELSTGLATFTKVSTMPDRWRCNADYPDNSSSNIDSYLQQVEDLRRARNHVIHHLCEHIPYEIDRYTCKAAVHSIFDRNLDNQPNNFKQNSPGKQVGGEYNSAFNVAGGFTSFSPNDAFAAPANPATVGDQPPTGQWGYDIPFQEEIANVARLWIRASEDVICNSNTPNLFNPNNPSDNTEGLQYARGNNMQFDCRRRLTLYYGRMWAIGQAKCGKILHDNTRLECISLVKDMIDNNSDDTPDGGRIYQDFAVIKPPQPGAVGNAFWGIYVA